MNRKLLLFIGKLIVSVALIYFLLSKINLDRVGERFADLNWMYGAVTALIFLALMANNTLRWMMVLKPIDKAYPFSKMFSIQYMGGFFNQTLPSAIGGDAVRVYLIHQYGATIKTAINGIILERVITLGGLAFLVTLVQPFMDIPDDKAPAKLIFPALSLLIIMGTVVLTQLDKFPEHFKKWKLFRGLANLAGDAKALFLSPAAALKSIFFGLAGNILLCVFTFQCAQSLGIDLSLTEALVLIPPAILLSTLPISIAGWGVRESAMVTSLSLAGVSEIDAFTLSIMFGLLMALFSLPGGLIWLLGRNKK